MEGIELESCVNFLWINVIKDILVFVEMCKYRICYWYNLKRWFGIVNFFF